MLIHVVAGDPRGRAPWIEALSRWGYDADDVPDEGPVLSDGRVRHRSKAAADSSAG